MKLSSKMPARLLIGGLEVVRNVGEEQSGTSFSVLLAVAQNAAAIFSEWSGLNKNEYFGDPSN